LLVEIGDRSLLFFELVAFVVENPVAEEEESDESHDCEHAGRARSSSVGIFRRFGLARVQEVDGQLGRLRFQMKQTDRSANEPRPLAGNVGRWSPLNGSKLRRESRGNRAAVSSTSGCSFAPER